ncbi:MAG: DNA alkylation repair protein [Mobilitalea sp.]
MEKSIKEQLLELAEEDYRRFTSALTPGKENILGIRIPLLRKLSKSILKGDWKAYLREAADDSLEEVMLQGMVIGGCKAEVAEKLVLASDFVPKIDCWSVCDNFCNALKDTAFRHVEDVWKFMQPYLYSEKEYDIRFGVVMMLYYLRPDYAPIAFEHFNRIKHEGYYVKMAVAWVLSMYYVKLPDITMEYLKNNTLDDFTYNKALQKIVESLRVDTDTKILIKSLRRK